MEAFVRTTTSLWLGVAVALVFVVGVLAPRWIRTKTLGSDLSAKSAAARRDAIEPSRPDWRTVEPRQLRPFKATYHITMGIQSDDPANLITIDKDYLNRLEQRRRTLAEQGPRVHKCLPGGDAAVRELYSYLMRDYLPQQYPGIFELVDGGKTVNNSATAKGFPTDWQDSDMDAALRTLGETVEEDMFLLHETEQGHFCDAFVCCFPSGFDPSEKVGKLLKDIHGPVPSYEKIGASMERFFSKLEVGKNVKRTNWSVQTHPELLAITGNHITEQDQSLRAKEEVVPTDCYLRVELQTLMRLPQTKAILFAFKTYVYPIRDIKLEGSGQELADAIEGLKKGNAPGMWVYKGSAHWGERLCEYLRSDGEE